MTEIVIPASIASYDIHEVCVAFIYHVMYMRQQLPMPFKDLKQQVRTANLNSTLTSGEQRRQAGAFRRKILLIQYMEQVHLQLAEIGKSHVIRRVNLLIGPSAASPREVYTIEFDTTGFAVHENYSSIEYVTRTMVRSLLEYWSSISRKMPPLSNIFLVLEVKQTENTHISAPLDLFVLKHIFKPKSRKGAPTPLRLLMRSFMTSCYSDQVDIGSEEEGIAYLCLKRPIKGIRQRK